MSDKELSAVERARARLRWQCRRGMQELDLLLLPFFDQFFDQLASGDQSQFERLLEATDADLYAWFMGIAHPEDDQLARMLALIRRSVKAGRLDWSRP